jgi:hypothetical protein
LVARGALLIRLGFVAIVVAFPLRALADDPPTLSGTWSATGLSETWSTTDWGDACGPKPTSQGAPGGTVTVAEQGGELSMSGAGRSFNTAQCWEQMPGLARSSHSASKRGWSTRCASAAGDPRHATVTTSVLATDDTITIAEQGVYEFIIEGTTCHASVSRSRSMKLIQRAGEAPAASATATPTPTAAPKPAPTPEPNVCSEPGPPARLEVRPSKKLLRPGETFQFNAAALDEKGCRTGARPTFRVEDASSTKLTVDERGNVSVDANAPEGTATVLVELGGKSVKISVEVAAKDRYDSLLKERGLNEQGEDDSAATVEISGGVGGAETRAEDVAKKRKQIFVGIVAGMAAVLALAGFILVRRGKRPPPEKATVEEDAGEPPAVAIFTRSKDQPMRCPRCNSLFPNDLGFCPNDGTALVPSVQGPGESSVSAPPPSSRRSSGTPESSTSSKRPSKTIEMICPTCGDRFGDGAQFCGKDGTSLVPIN